MADVAQLGLAVDSSQVKSATAALNQLNTASAAAAKGADRLAASGQKSETVMRAIDASAKRLGISTAEMEKRVNAAAAARQKMDTASSKAVKGMQDLSEQTKRTANDNQKLGEQTDKTSGSLDKFATRFTRGLIAGAVITAVQQLTQYVLQLNSALAQTADTAQRVGLSGQQIQGFQAAAGYKGISSADFNSAMMGFNQQIDLARHGLGDLQTLLRANGMSVKDTATTFGQVADLVRNAGSEAQKFSILQQAGLPATREFVKLMEQGGGAINNIAATSAKLSDQQLEEAKKLDERWNEIWVNFENSAKRAIVGAANALQGMAAPSWLKSFGSSSFWERFYNQYDLKAAGITPVSRFDAAFDGLANQPRHSAVESELSRRASQINGTKTFNPEIAKQQVALEQQRLGLLGPLITAEEARRQVELQIQAAGLNNIGIDAKRAETLKQLAYETNLGITAIKANSDALTVEAQTIGMSAGQAAAFSAAQTILNEKKRLGIAVTDEQREAILREADAMGRAKDGVDNLRSAHDTFQSSFTDFSQQIRNGATAWDAFRAAGANALGRIADKLASMAADNLWNSAFGGSSGLSGIIGALFGAGPGTGTTSATAGASSFMMGGQSFPMFAAAGGGTFGPGWGVVGERGPELIKVNKGSVTVVPNHVSKPYLPGFAEGGMLSAIGNVTRLPFGQDNRSAPTQIINNYDFRGADPSMKGWIKAQIKISQDQTLKASPGYTAKVNRDRPGMRR